MNGSEQHTGGGTLAEGVEVTPIPAVEAAPKESEPKRNPWADRWARIDSTWLDKAPPPRDWLLTRPKSECDREAEGFFPCGKVGILAAAGGTGKTMALIQLALAVATGEKWLGHYSTPKPGRVLLALGEEDAEEMRRRIHQAVTALNMTPQAKAHAMARIDVLPLAGEAVAFVNKDPKTGEVGERLSIEQLREQLRERVQNTEGEPGHEPWRLLVLDPLSRFAGPDSETDNAAATRFVQAVESLTKVPGNPAVLLAHHTTKSTRGKDTDSLDSTAARGASALVDGVRWVATLLADKSDDSDELRTVTLQLAKSNYTAPAPKHQVKRGDFGVLVELTNTERASLNNGSGANRQQRSAKGNVVE